MLVETAARAVRAVALIALCLVGACVGGGGYTVPRAIVVIEVVNEPDAYGIIEIVGAHFLSQGFTRTDLDNMRETMRSMGRSELEIEARVAARFPYAGATYAHPNGTTRVTLSKSLTDIELSSARTYADVDGPIVTIDMFEHRPSGFTPESIAAFQAMVVAMQDRLHREVTVVREPWFGNPEVDRKTEQRKKVKIAVQWVVGMVLWLAVLGAMIGCILRRFPWSVTTKRIVFVVLCCVLATPVLVPTFFLGLLIPIVVIGALSPGGLASVLALNGPLPFAGSFVVSALIAWWAWR